MIETEIISEIQTISGIPDIKNMSQADARAILTLVGQQRLKEAHISALIKLVPGFIGMTQVALNSQMEVVRNAGAIQSQVLATLQSTIDGLS